jgi:hypothetical protein
MALEWIAAVVESPGGLDILVWYEPETDLVLDIRLTRDVLAEAPALFAEVTQRPKAGEPRTPTRIRVADQQLADALRGNIGDVEVVVGDISDAREMLGSLIEYAARVHTESQVDPQAWARLFHAAAELYRAKPWQVLPADAWVEVDCEALDITAGALSVVGQAGDSEGFTLCRTVEDATGWLSAGERRALGKPAEYPDEFFMFSYNTARELDPEDVAEVKEQGWELAGPTAYPAFTVIDHGEGRLPTQREVAGMTVFLEALATMVRDEPEIALAWEREPIDWHGEVAGSRVRFAAPLEVPEPRADPEDASLDILDETGQVDDLRFDRYREALMTRLSAREDIPDETLAAAEMLVEFAATYHGVTFSKIDAAQLEALLLETIPAQLAVEANEAGRIVAAARELMRFARDELGSSAAADALARLDDAFEQRLARELDNPNNFGTGKQLVMAGIAAGYDMSTEEGVAEFVQAFAQSQREVARPARKAKAKRPAPKAKTAAKPKAKAKRTVAPAKAKTAAKSKSKAAKAKPRKKR